MVAVADPRDVRRARLRALADAEQAKLNEAFVIAEAEGLVGDRRIADLTDMCRAARRRVAAARGRLTRAQRGDDQAAIAAAVEQLSGAQQECDRLHDQAIGEMGAIVDAGLERLDEMILRIDIAWAAQAAVTNTFRGDR